MKNNQRQHFSKKQRKASRHQMTIEHSDGRKRRENRFEAKIKGVAYKPGQ